MTPQNELILTCLISVKPRLFHHHMDQIHVCRAYNLNGWIASVCHLPHKSIKKFCFALKKNQNIRNIIDCTEFFCAQPRSFHRQGNSSYTSHTSFGFISDAFSECSISDREITIQSGLLDKLHRGDLVLVDRAITFKDLLSKKQI